MVWSGSTTVTRDLAASIRELKRHSIRTYGPATVAFTPGPTATRTAWARADEAKANRRLALHVVAS